jgi:broad specificity phosphatase PhoE
MKTIYLVRHGRTQANADSRFQGWEDHPLNADGLAQAEALAERAGKLPIDAIYATDLIRTVQTAAPLAKRLGLPVTPVRDLKEISFGEWEGKVIGEIMAREREKLTQLWRHPTSITLEGGENFLDAQKRGWKALNAIREGMEEGSSVLIVSHGGMIRLLLCRALDMPVDSMWRIALDNTAACKLQFDSHTGIRIGYVNETGKL